MKSGSGPGLGLDRKSSDDAEDKVGYGSLDQLGCRKYDTRVHRLGSGVFHRRTVDTRGTVLLRTAFACRNKAVLTSRFKAVV